MCPQVGLHCGQPKTTLNRWADRYERDRVDPPSPFLSVSSFYHGAQETTGRRKMYYILTAGSINLPHTKTRPTSQNQEVRESCVRVHVSHKRIRNLSLGTVN